MISNPPNALKLLFSGFKNQSDEEEEEGLIDYSTEMNPKNFKVDLQLTPIQLTKFFEYYNSRSVDPADYKFTKVSLNRISNILHNHYHKISGDIKLFKQYKIFMQIVTQDLSHWIEKDFYCGDVILEILKELQSRRDNPKYGKLINDLGIDFIVQRQLEKSVELRQKAESERLVNKRKRNWEKARKKNEEKKKDPYDSIPLPVKRPLIDNPETFEVFKKQSFDDCEEFEGYLPPQFAELTVPDELKAADTEPQTIFHSFPENTLRSEQVFNDIMHSSDMSDTLEVEEWFKVNTNEEMLFTPAPHQRPSSRPQDPRVSVTLLCKGLDSLLSTPCFSSQLEKFIVVINIKCLVCIITNPEVKSFKVQMPKDAIQVIYQDSPCCICLRPSVKKFLDFLSKISELHIFSEYPQELVKLVFPSCDFIFNKKLEFNRELLLVFDNDNRGWDGEFFVPLLYYTPCIGAHSMSYNASACKIESPEHSACAQAIASDQLELLEAAMRNIYSSFIDRKAENYAIWELKEYLRTLFEGIEVDLRVYQERIGMKGYSKMNLKIYTEVLVMLGATIGENCQYCLVEEKTKDNEISGVCVLSTLWSFAIIPKF